MARCSFCRETVNPGTGMLLVKNDGRMFHFCSMKCEKNLLKLNHVARTTRWTRTFVTEKKKHAKTHAAQQASIAAETAPETASVTASETASVTASETASVTAPATEPVVASDADKDKQ